MEDDKKEESNDSASKNDGSNNSQRDIDDDQEMPSNYDTESEYSGEGGVDFATLDRGLPKTSRALRRYVGRKSKPARRVGRVQKRRSRNRNARYLPKGTGRSATTRRHNRNRNYLAATSIKRQSKSQSFACQYCGHRCCQRARVQPKRVEKRKCRRPKMKRGKVERNNKRNTFISDNNRNVIGNLKKLGMWTQAAKTSAIMKHLKTHYPISWDDGVLEKELVEKLRAAVVAGVVTQVSNDSWELSRPLPKTRTKESHVTQFWELYGDTMSPITQKDVKTNENDKDDMLEDDEHQ